MPGTESLAELKPSARLGKTLPAGCLVGGWLRIRLKLSTAQILSNKLRVVVLGLKKGFEFRIEDKKWR